MQFDTKTQIQSRKEILFSIENCQEKIIVHFFLSNRIEKYASCSNTR